MAVKTTVKKAPEKKAVHEAGGGEEGHYEEGKPIKESKDTNGNKGAEKKQSHLRDSYEEGKPIKDTNGNKGAEKAAKAAPFSMGGLFTMVRWFIIWLLYISFVLLFNGWPLYHGGMVYYMVYYIVYYVIYI
jgi:hypothetical protein